MATFVTPVDYSIGTTLAWTDIDVSTDVPAGAAGVIIHFVNTNSAAEVEFGLRKNGSTDDRHRDIRRNFHGWAVIGVDSSRIFEAYIETTDLDIYLVGYLTEDEAVFFDNATDKSTETTGSFVDVDISSDTGADTAIAACIEVTVAAGTQAWGARQNGSTDDRVGTNSMNQQFWNIVGVDASEIFEQQIETTAGGGPDLYLTGYITDSLVWNTNATDRSTATTGSYEDVAALPAGAVGGLYQFYQKTAQVQGCALRKNGSAEDLYYDAVQASHQDAYVECDGSGIVEQKIEHTNSDLFEIGYFEASPTGGGETVVGAGLTRSLKLNRLRLVA